MILSFALVTKERKLGQAWGQATREEFGPCVKRKLLNWCGWRKSSSPGPPSWIEMALVSCQGKIVYDFDDAVHEQFRDSPHAAVRAVLGNKIPSTVAKPSHVLAGNSTLHDYFSTQLGADSLLIPSTINTNRLSPA